MSPTNKSRGRWFHRFLIGLFTVLLTLLSVWLIGFVLDDIGTVPGPQYPEVEKGFLSQALLDDANAADEQLAELIRKLHEQQSRQSLLRDSTARYEQTMRQLVELQRMVRRVTVICHETYVLLRPSESPCHAGPTIRATASLSARVLLLGMGMGIVERE